MSKLRKGAQTIFRWKPLQNWGIHIRRTILVNGVQFIFSLGRLHLAFVAQWTKGYK